VNVAQVLSLGIAVVASVVLFLVLRYPQLRRPQFQDGRSFSASFSLVCALAVFAVYPVVRDPREPRHEGM
jgi:hypothetical protein